MTKKIKQFKDSFNEEKARVRLYKSGKNWIKAGIKEIQLLRVCLLYTSDAADE